MGRKVEAWHACAAWGSCLTEVEAVAGGVEGYVVLDEQVVGGMDHVTCDGFDGSSSLMSSK